MWKRGQGAIYPLFHKSIYIFIREMPLLDLFSFLSFANLICRGTDVSKYFRESIGPRDNETRLYEFHCEVSQMRSRTPIRTEHIVMWTCLRITVPRRFCCCMLNYSEYPFNRIYPAFANSVDPDQLASSEAN